MSNEEFLLDFLIEYNKLDRNAGHNSRDFWKGYEKKGYFLYLLRNIIIHELVDVGILEDIEQRIGYDNIVSMFQNLQHPIDDMLKAKCALLIADYYEEYFKKKGYFPYNCDDYFYFVKETNIIGVFKSIFIYKNNSINKGFFNYSIHSYDYIKRENNNIVLNNSETTFYVEGMPEEDKICIFDKSIDNLLNIFKHGNDCYEITIPLLDQYADIRDYMGLGPTITNKLYSVDDFNKYVNKIFPNDYKEFRELEKKITKSMKEIKEDIYNIKTYKKL